MIVLIVALGLLIISFAAILLVGPPYLPTLKPQVIAALELSQLKTGQTLLELGCGDGRVLAAAAKKGIRVVGYELNPFLALLAWLRTRRYGRQVTVIWGNFWRADWPETDAIFCFLLGRFMKKLDKKCMQYPFKPIKLISFAFSIPGRKPLQKKAGLYLYEYDKS